MSKRDKAIARLAEVLGQHLPMTPHDACHGIAEGIVDVLLELTEKKPKKGQSEGAQLYDRFAILYQQKFGIEPERNPMVNNQCAQIVRRVGLERALLLTEFYLQQTDAFYVRNMFQVGHLLKDCEMLSTRMRAGKTISRKAADKIESAGATMSASSSYLQRKYSQKSTIPEEGST